MWKHALLGALLVGCLSGAAYAQNNLHNEPGYIDLSAVEKWFDGEAKVIVNVKGALLNLVAEASRYEDPELADLLQRLKSIQVRGFNLSRSDRRAVEGHVSEMARRLDAEGWDTVVRVREDDENVDIFVRVDQDVIAGMMVMVVTPREDESFFVNIVGEIDPAQIGRLGRKFDIGPLDDMTVDY